MLDTNLTPGDAAVLRQLAVEAAGGAGSSAEAFARSAMRWLAARHGYSLKSELPPGSGDPLVRWLRSKEPGHCELFAGGFALLARAAGFPTRVVAGFVGGSWNDDYLMVRNSDAHAWCEIYEGEGRWLRVDPTNDGPRLLLEERGARVGDAKVRSAARGWAARFDRLRMLWYRRVVNFDQAEQQQLLHTLKDSAQGFGQRVRDWSARAAERLRAWLVRPWNLGRSLDFGAWLGAGAAALYFVFKYAGPVARRWRPRGRGAADPVRREAGRWLRRWAERPGSPELRADLERLRYGPRESWPEPARIFRECRRAWNVRGARDRGTASIRSG